MSFFNSIGSVQFKAKVEHSRTDPINLNSSIPLTPSHYLSLSLPTRSLYHDSRSMGRSSKPKRSPTQPSMPNFDGQPSAPWQQQQQQSASVTTSSSKPLYLCNPFVRSALIKGSFKTIVTLPKYVDRNEWVAVNRE